MLQVICNDERITLEDREEIREFLEGFITNEIDDNTILKMETHRRQ